MAKFQASARCGPLTKTFVAIFIVLFVQSANTCSLIDMFKSARCVFLASTGFVKPFVSCIPSGVSPAKISICRFHFIDDEGHRHDVTNYSDALRIMPNKPIFLVCHGWWCPNFLLKLFHSDFTRILGFDLLESMSEFNIVFVEWTSEASKDYNLVVDGLCDVIEPTAIWLDFYLNYVSVNGNRSIFVGHSLGGHVLGQALKMLVTQNSLHCQRIKLLLLLDAAGPKFEGIKLDYLNPCYFVVAFHSTWDNWWNLGSSERLGDYDYGLKLKRTNIRGNYRNDYASPHSDVVYFGKMLFSGIVDFCMIRSKAAWHCRIRAYGENDDGFELQVSMTRVISRLSTGIGYLEVTDDLSSDSMALRQIIDADWFRSL